MTPTVGDALRLGIERLRASGAERPRLDVELLLGHATGLSRTSIVAHPEAPLPMAALATFRAGLARRERGEPVAYIRGVKEFYGLIFRADRRALIPRPETELLVELAGGLVAQRLEGPDGPDGPDGPEGPAQLRLVDVGTGSGAIPVALAALLRRRGWLDRVEILATDQSPEALELAADNLRAHDLAARIRLAEADLLPSGEPPFDLVLANLPYIPTGDIANLPVAASFEPRSALDGGRDGLAVIRRLLARLPGVLAGNGVALLEIGGDQETALHLAVAELLPRWRSRVERDLAGLPRVAVVERPA